MIEAFGWMRGLRGFDNGGINKVLVLVSRAGHISMSFISINSSSAKALA